MGGGKEGGVSEKEGRDSEKEGGSRENVDWSSEKVGVVFEKEDAGSEVGDAFGKGVVKVGIAKGKVGGDSVNVDESGEATEKGGGAMGGAWCESALDDVVGSEGSSRSVDAPVALSTLLVESLYHSWKLKNGRSEFGVLYFGSFKFILSVGYAITLKRVVSSTVMKFGSSDCLCF